MSQAVERFQIQNELGMHARAATKFVQTANKFRCGVTVEKDGQQVNGRALLETIAPKVGARVATVASQRRPNWSGGPPKREHLALLYMIK